jgi:hypothetical protein
MPQIQNFFAANRQFSAVEVTAAMEQLEYIPEMLGAMGERLFPTVRSRFRTIAVYRRFGRLSLIPVSPIGAPPVELELPGADIRDFRTRRLAKGSTLTAEELQGVLDAPEAIAVRTVQQELALRGAQLRQDQELTHEHMRMGALFGKVLDADGVTVLDDWFANWGVAEPTPVNFALTTATTNVRAKCKQVRDLMRLSSKGGWVNGRTQVHALTGSSFFDLLVTHPNVEKLWLNWQAARDLAQEIPEQFEFGGIVWHDFRGTDDGTTISIADDEAHFFPVGARDFAQRVLGPAEFFPFINTPGRDLYALTIPDRDRDAWVRLEEYSYPLYVCLRPEMIQKGVEA